ncbi:NADP oxidoreductase [Pseudomonas asuensis]|uniref:NADP oxidoreductase n=1 Tax=Pseudomonas asuensis TaxID=1825787 RepID=A0ABQ2H461_9PSED|nr:NADP oxidoreductase [Pseudomonas asuensis]
MRIGIIGAGQQAKGIAYLALANGHEVMLSNSRGPDTLADVQSELLQCKLGTVEEACRFGQLVVVSVPLKNFTGLPQKAFAGRTVVDTNNYYPERDGHITELDQRLITTSELLARALPASVVVKAFNAILAQDLYVDARPSGSSERRALPIAGDDEQAKRQVASFIESLGFDVVDAGSLANSWRFER